MTISAEHFTNMDGGLKAHRQDAMQTIFDQLASGELAETHDLCESICVDGLTYAYAELVAQGHDAEDPALHSGVKKALIAGSHLANIILPELAETPVEHLHALPAKPDHSDVASVYAWAQHQPETGKLAMNIAGLLARQEGDESLTIPLATAMSFAMYHATTHPIQGTQPAA